jgi:hypothetical protein
MHDPREPHYALIKRVLRYLHGTLDHGIQLWRTTTSTLVAYSDADWVGCPDTRRSTSRYTVFLGDNLALGHRSGYPLFLVLVLKLSIALLPML